MQKMSDDQLDKIVGGFREAAEIPTKGKDIKCPVCKKDSGISTLVLYDPNPKTNTVEYSCNCGTKFVCYGKQVILKDKWIQICKKKGYTYPFQ